MYHLDNSLGDNSSFLAQKIWICMCIRAFPREKINSFIILFMTSHLSLTSFQKIFTPMEFFFFQKIHMHIWKKNQSGINSILTNSLLNIFLHSNEKNPVKIFFFSLFFFFFYEKPQQKNLVLEMPRILKSCLKFHIYRTS